VIHRRQNPLESTCMDVDHELTILSVLMMRECEVMSDKFDITGTYTSENTDAHEMITCRAGCFSLSAYFNSRTAGWIFIDITKNVEPFKF
jgi:hypothetical protein